MTDHPTVEDEAESQSSAPLNEKEVSEEEQELAESFAKTAR